MKEKVMMSAHYPKEAEKFFLIEKNKCGQEMKL